jgi:hypothetical protein
MEIYRVKQHEGKQEQRQRLLELVLEFYRRGNVHGSQFWEHSKALVQDPVHGRTTLQPTRVYPRVQDPSVHQDNVIETRDHTGPRRITVYTMEDYLFVRRGYPHS